MSLLRIRIAFSGQVDPLGPQIERMADLRPVFMGAIRDLLAMVFDKQFATQGAAYSSPWRPLTRKYAQATRRRRRGGILHLSGRLRASLGKPVAPEGVRIYDKLEMRYGSTVRTPSGHNLARIHDLGLGRNPERAILPRLKKQQIEATMLRFVGEYISTGRVVHVSTVDVP